MSATTDRPARVQVIELWTGGDADQLRQSLRMTNESFAEYLGVAVRTVACWRKQPGIIPRPVNGQVAVPGGGQLKVPTPRVDQVLFKVVPFLALASRMR